MSTNTQNAPETKQSKSDEIKTKANAGNAAVESKVEKELAEFALAYAGMVKAAKNVGPLGRIVLARAVGHSVTKIGRPSVRAYGPLASVLVHYRDEKGNSVSFKERDSLYSIALKAVGKSTDEGAWVPKNDEELSKAKERFVKAKGKGSEDTASMNLRMSRPAAEEIALGE